MRTTVAWAAVLLLCGALLGCGPRAERAVVAKGQERPAMGPAVERPLVVNTALSAAPTMPAQPKTPAWPRPSAATPSPTASAPAPAAREPIQAVVEWSDITALQSRRLAVPVDGVTTAMLRDTFGDPRSKGAHEALDIGAPMRTPVRAVEDGSVAKLFISERGGLTVYQYDPSRRYAYYYAHLDAYAPGLSEGQQIQRCDLIGWVGVTGNSPANAPHLHFAVFKLEQPPRWWRGAALNPYVLMNRGPEAAEPCPPLAANRR